MSDDWERRAKIAEAQVLSVLEMHSPVPASTSTPWVTCNGCTNNESWENCPTRTAINSATLTTADDLRRFRCCNVGCNPELYGNLAAQEHKQATGHRIALWPVRSPEGKKREQERNETGYHKKYSR